MKARLHVVLAAVLMAIFAVRLVTPVAAQRPETPYKPCSPVQPHAIPCRKAGDFCAPPVLTKS